MTDERESMLADAWAKECDAHKATQAEVARLQEELERMRQSRDRSEQGKLDERDAHEATDKVVEQLRAMLGKVAIIVHLHESSPEWQNAALCMREIRCLIDFNTLKATRDQLCLLGQRAVDLSNELERERTAHEATKALASRYEGAVKDWGDKWQREAVAHEATKAGRENALANCLHVQRERDEARARVAELEAEISAAHAGWRADLAKLDKLRESFARDVSVHRQASEFAEKGAQAAEARVAELERLLEQERAEVEMKQAALDGSTRTWREQKAALDQARGLLEAWETEAGHAADLNDSRRSNTLRDCAAQLRAITTTTAEPARPAATCTCGAESSGGPCLCTPAAPGAEPKDTCCVCGQPCTSYVCLGCENSGAGT